MGKIKEAVFNGAPTDDFIQYFLVRYRWIFVCCFLLPCSVIYNCMLWVRNWIVFRLSSAPAAHDKKVTSVQAQVREWNKKCRPNKMCTARPGWQSTSFRMPKYKENMTQITVNLVDVLKVDEEKQIVRVEPMVTMGQLTATLLPLGWTIPVVPELDDLTVGGLINGSGLETSSHIYGLFQHICVSHQLVLADGSLVACSKNENSDLFYSVPWSHGTLGFLVASELKIIPAKPFVEIDYIPCTSMKSISQRFEDEVRDKEKNEFVEAIMYTQDTGVIMTGRFYDKPKDPSTVNEIGRYWKPWFYKHVEEYLTEVKDSYTEYIPLRDYYHRHTRSLFWELYDIIPFGNHPAFRYLFGWAVPPKVSFLKLTQPQAVKRMYESHHLLQDIFVPLNKFQPAITHFHREAMLYPLWICPFILPPEPGLVHPEENQPQLYIDIGAYGNPPLPGFSPREAVRSIEAYAIDVRGFQMTYADTYMREDEFRAMFDLSLYDRVRQKYGAAEAFPTIYDKLKKSARQ